MMSKLSIFLQILKNAIEKPQLLQELSEERSEIKEDKKFKTHEYSYDFDSVDDFFVKLVVKKPLASNVSDVYYLYKFYDKRGNLGYFFHSSLLILNLTLMFCLCLE